MRYLSVILLTIFNFVFLPSTTISIKSHPITTLLNAKWLSTPIYLEIAEFLSNENENFYWDFINDIVNLPTPITSLDNDQKRYEIALKLASGHLLPTQISLLKLSVALHSLTPQIQSHLQISKTEAKNNDCSSNIFVRHQNKFICNLEKLKQINKKDQNVESPDLYEFDHVYPGSNSSNNIVILYGDIGSAEFSDWYKILKTSVEQKNIRLIIRNYIKIESNRKVRLSGYGVELHLKSTEYKSQDDSTKSVSDSDSELNDDTEDNEVEGINFNVLKVKYPHLVFSLEQFKKDLLEKHETIEPLKAWEFQDLGLQAAKRVLSFDGDESLQMLQFTAQNFPTQAKSLLHVKVDDDLRQEIKINTDVFAKSLNIQPPDAALFVNGLYFDAETLDIFTLIDTLRHENKVMDGLYKIGLKTNSIESFLSLNLGETASKEFAIDIRDSGIVWINDLESDAQYRRWSGSVLDLLRPTFPGMMRNVRKNLYNLVIVFDPVTPEARGIIKLAESFIAHSAPLRLGLVFNTNTKNNVYGSITCAFNYAMQQTSPRSALTFLIELFTSIDSKDNVTIENVKKQLKKSFKLSTDQVDDIVGEDSDYDYGRSLANEFIDRLGMNESPVALLNGIPLKLSTQNTDDFEESVLTEIMQQTPNLQKAIYRGELDDSMSIIDYLMNQPHVMPRLSKRILSTKDERYLDLTGTPFLNLHDLPALNKLSQSDMIATLVSNLKYFKEKSTTEKFMGQKLHFITIWIVGDLNVKATRQNLLNALEFVKNTKGVRVSFIPNVESESLLNGKILNNLVWASLNTLNDNDAVKLVKELIDADSLDSVKIPSDVNGFLDETMQHLKLLRVFNQRVLNLDSSSSAVIVNGRILGPLEDDEVFTIEDFNLIEKFSSFYYTDKLRTALKTSVNPDDFAVTSNDFLRLCGLLSSHQSVKTRYTLPSSLLEDHSVKKLQPKNTTFPSFNLVAVVDPASRGAQKLASFLIMLRNVVNCDLKVFMYAVEKHSDLPVKNFYRFVVESEPQFLKDGRLTEGPIAKFVGLPANVLLTQTVVAPENWLVEVVRSVYDLDNIKLSEIGGPVHSEYELEYLLLEGHCFDSSSGAPPRGLQVTLGTKEEPVIVDTIVMANLGYFQLKANPGTWMVQLRQGKSADLYDISNADGPNTKHYGNHTRVTILSFNSHVLKLSVTKKPGKHNIDLLSDESETGNGIWSSITNTFSTTDNSEKEVINIFSVASGHLYERLLRIMMLSLLKHTKSPVKFWFLKNYLSPQFVDFLPYMAKSYKFDYELVQYKWPRWLHQQTEKQRIIWGYKILFLDVLFPLDIKKFIFVDADQIVRADMKELYQIDLDGAPYGYTPFCDSRKEMEGFRFWKIGYWKNHLQGRRYHISALYVVDLQRFRRIAAGDRLRGQYQALSQDPNSLSNLDQDLPNNMIHQVPIKSLPQEWLWCETWCSDEFLKTAKTIDLCNNPQTKEAKLTAAQRIVPEWKDYDEEIKQLLLKMEDEEEHSTSSRKITSGANDKHDEL